ncbi:hypothetical protein [uncultured Aquimarina sp.]|uniref:hypothetical protein n=1 Tax=uncultured Aquimarina sp. TaxID=575652 RepID=UPI00261552C7|nr:hypothetical protein [uncultured Aquimarina sp.]
MKKVYKYIFTISLILTIVLSCTTYDYEEPNNGAGITLGINSLNLGLADEVTQTRINDTVIFTDLSIDSANRIWTVMENSAQIDILGSSDDRSSSRETFTAVFKEVGEVGVELRPTFNNPLTEESPEFVEFNFNVLPLIEANFTTNIPIINGELVIEAGETITFTNTSSELENATWSIINFDTEQEVANSDSVDSFITSIGSVGDFVVSLTAFTNEPFSQDVISVPFRVIPSSAPLTVAGQFNENEAGQIVVPFSRDLDANTLDEPSNFELFVNGVPATVSIVSLDPENASNLLITPANNIKNFETATLSYTRVNLNSADSVEAPSFSDITVTPFGGVNLFPKGDFELASEDNYDVNNGFLGINANQVSISFQDGVGINNSRAIVFSSVAGAIPGSRRIAFGDKNGNTNPDGVNILTPVEDGVTYIIRMKVKYTGVPPDEVNFGFIKLPFAQNTRVQIQLNADLIEGEFVDAIGEFTVVAGTQPDMYALANVTIGGGPSEIIYDDIQVFEKDL